MGAQRHLGIVVADERGLEKGDAVDVNRPELVVDRHRIYPVVRREHVDTRLAHPLRLKTEPRGRVVVAARQHDARPRAPYRAEGIRQREVRLRRGDRRVEDVSRHEHNVDFLRLDDASDGVDHLPEMLESGVRVKRSSDMPVRRVQEPHDSERNPGGRHS